ncbi:hypothetical protein CCHR01_04125 [Colletotrichum chrysophilum]|uniref:Secreted protein n=1 Tax=Colletotrichum chrysophilum TaxID=1836956 RepID=A0AAD9AUY6_9PEZI|nr:hypothetical protein CCHR01_04125 [Colletotrichum chrysophilum]
MSVFPGLVLFSPLLPSLLPGCRPSLFPWAPSRPSEKVHITRRRYLPPSQGRAFLTHLEPVPTSSAVPHSRPRRFPPPRAPPRSSSPENHHQPVRLCLLFSSPNSCTGTVSKAKKLTTLAYFFAQRSFAKLKSLVYRLGQRLDAQS